MYHERILICTSVEASYLKKWQKCFALAGKQIVNEFDCFTYDRGYQNYSDISDDCLDDFVKETLQNFPNCGIRRIIAFLLGIHFT